jgi:hypothetical protein
MEPIMADETGEEIALRRRIERGDEAALLELYTRHRSRLKRSGSGGASAPR